MTISVSVSSLHYNLFELQSEGMVNIQRSVKDSEKDMTCDTTMGGP